MGNFAVDSPEMTGNVGGKSAHPTVAHRPKSHIGPAYPVSSFFKQSGSDSGSTFVTRFAGFSKIERKSLIQVTTNEMQDAR